MGHINILQLLSIILKIPSEIYDTLIYHIQSNLQEKK